jgi:predicted nucleic acid-binding Zn ribbon protein
MLESLGRLLPKNLKRAGVGKSIDAAMIAEECAKALAEAFGDDAAHLRVVSFKNGILKVACDHSAYAEDLRLRERELVAAMNARIGENRVTSVKSI